jgi:dihydroorotate dehydrogenase (fumarate)
VEAPWFVLEPLSSEPVNLVIRLIIKLKQASMANLETHYMGLKLKSPIMVSSSGLSNSIEKIKEAEKYGAGAIVLKSIFEEQIDHEAEFLQNTGAENPESFDYLQGYLTANNIENYYKQIKEAKSSVKIPIIASIHCHSHKKWIEFAQNFEKAGADAIELNIYIIPDDRNKEGRDYEKIYVEIVKQLVKKVKIPVAVKLTYQFTNPLNMIDQFRSVGAKGVVLFNRYYEPDIDIEKFEIINTHTFSVESDLRFALRWAAIIRDRVKGIDTASSTGVHSSTAAIKMILAGVSAVQVCSVLYQKGMSEIEKINSGIELWMRRRGFDTIENFQGLMSYKSIPNPEVYHRSQFMKYFTNFD